MGSIAVLTTTGDNDPEIEPVQSYRHYLYCDACGSFELEPWERPGSAAIRRRRRWLADLAMWATSGLLVPAWQALGSGFRLSLLLYLAIALACARVLFAWLWGTPERIAPRWRFAARSLPWLAAFLGAEWLCGHVPCWSVAATGALLIAAALAWRTALADHIVSMGLRCRGCAATYGHQTAFFRDLEANPRALSVSDVPRPLGRSPFLPGRTVEPAPAAPAPRLP